MIFYALLALFIGVDRLYYYQNGGFSVSKVLSKAPTVSIESSIINPLLDQAFHLIGSGGTSFVFLGEDDKTILKLFNHQHLNYNPWFLHLKLPGFLDSFRIQRFLKKKSGATSNGRNFSFKAVLLQQGT